MIPRALWASSET